MQNSIVTRFNLKIYTDFILEEQPTTFEHAVEIFEQISQNFGSKEFDYEYAVPKTVQLMPLKVVSI